MRDASKNYLRLKKLFAPKKIRRYFLGICIDIQIAFNTEVKKYTEL